jgi:hypothetical protein
MENVVFFCFVLAILFILAAVSLDYVLFRMGHKRDQAVRTDWSVCKQLTARDLLFAKSIAGFFAFVFAFLFVVFVTVDVLFSSSVQ